MVLRHGGAALLLAMRTYIQKLPDRQQSWAAVLVDSSQEFLPRNMWQQHCNV